MSKKSTEFFQSVRIFPAVFVRIFEKVICKHCCGCAFWSYNTPVQFHNLPHFSTITAASEQHHSYYFTGRTCYFAVHHMKSITEIIPTWTKQYGCYMWGVLGNHGLGWKQSILILFQNCQVLIITSRICQTKSP